MTRTMLWEWLGVGTVAFVVAAVVTLVRLRFGHRGLVQPGHRGLHDKPTPHGGGLGIVVAAIGCGAWAGVDGVWLLALGVLAAVSWLDDLLNLPFWLRLLVHLGAAWCVATIAMDYPLSWLVPAAVIIAWTTNAYNFMDGADGLAGSMGVVGFGAYALLLAVAGEFGLAVLCLAIACGALAFLLFNWHPARIFMGDIGSIPLGFAAGGVGLYGIRHDVWSGWFPVVVFAPFLFDASATLLRRLLRGEKVWQAHREHYYQRMIRGGQSHAEVCGQWLMVMLAGAAFAVLLQRVSPPLGWLGAACWCAVLVIMGYGIDARWRKKM